MPHPETDIETAAALYHRGAARPGGWARRLADWGLSLAYLTLPLFVLSMTFHRSVAVADLFLALLASSALLLTASSLALSREHRQAAARVSTGSPGGPPRYSPMFIMTAYALVQGRRAAQAVDLSDIENDYLATLLRTRLRRLEDEIGQGEAALRRLDGLPGDHDDTLIALVTASEETRLRLLELARRAGEAREIDPGQSEIDYDRAVRAVAGRLIES